MTRISKFVAIVLAFFSILGAPFAAGQEKAITVFAAASMKNALDDINAAFMKRTGIKVSASYAASSALMKQIEEGAPADVFASADLDWMDYGSQKKIIKDATRVNLLGNQLVLIAPKDSNGIETLFLKQEEGSMKLSARNQLKGKIVEVKRGATTAHVRIDIGGQIVTASITNESADELKLAVGQTAYAIIKASSVMVAVD